LLVFALDHADLLIILCMAKLTAARPVGGDMELREALAQISAIRRQVARTEVFRGYRALPVAFSGVLAFVAAGVQAVFLPEPAHQVGAYLALWVGAAAVSMLATGVEMFWHCRHSQAPLTQEMTWLAVSQFLPSVVAGGLVTFVVAGYAPESLWMLPGLWAVLFSLGIFASYRLLPRATFWVGLFYMTAGILCLAFAQGPAELSPWAMGIPFGCGQLLAAGVLYWTLERKDGEPSDE
jgi:hypothetical protein